MPSASEKLGVEPSALYFIDGGIIYSQAFSITHARAHALPTYSFAHEDTQAAYVHEESVVHHAADQAIHHLSSKRPPNYRTITNIVLRKPGSWHDLGLANIVNLKDGDYHYRAGVRSFDILVQLRCDILSRRTAEKGRMEVDTVLKLLHEEHDGALKSGTVRQPVSLCASEYGSPSEQ